MTARAPEMKRAHILYAGLVQGVGFRYGADRTAERLGLTGWVMNRNDGKVEVVCEGGEEAIVAFLAQIDDLFGRFIRDRDVTWSRGTGEFAGFDIRFE